MPKPNLQSGPWPWRWEPGNGFHNVAVHGRISAGFEIKTHMVDDREYDRSPQLVARDLAIVMVMAALRASAQASSSTSPRRPRRRAPSWRGSNVEDRRSESVVAPLTALQEG